MGSRLFIFGGEDVLRRPLGELLVLDLNTMTWSKPETQGGYTSDGCSRRGVQLCTGEGVARSWVLRAGVAVDELQAMTLEKRRCA